MKTLSFTRTAFTQTTLSIAGLLVVYIGLEILFKPIAFYAANQISLPENVSLLNELRANGSYLVASGAILIAGAFVRAMQFTSLLLGGVLFSSFALTRITSVVFDGIPSVSLMYAMGIECVFAVLLVIAFIRHTALSSDSK